MSSYFFDFLGLNCFQTDFFVFRIEGPNSYFLAGRLN